jgi:hypothetical protein
MLIRSEDLDKQLLDRVMAGIIASYRKPNPSEAERRIQQEEKKRFAPETGPLLGGVGAALGLAGGTFGALVGAGLMAADAALGLAIGMFFMVGTVVLVPLGLREAKRVNVLHSDLLAGWLPHLELSRVDRAYCDALVQLSKPELKVDEPTARTILQELNRLVEQSRRLAAQRDELASLSTGAAEQAIETERDGISARLAAVTDPVAHDTLQQSLALCDQRLENARAIQPAVERIDAQQEMILQTLGAIHSNLTRLETAHQALGAADVDAIRHEIQEISRRAAAVESATREVQALRVGR